MRPGPRFLPGLCLALVLGGALWWVCIKLTAMLWAYLATFL
jgi:hypothetical protein